MAAERARWGAELAANAQTMRATDTCFYTSKCLDMLNDDAWRLAVYKDSLKSKGTHTDAMIADVRYCSVATFIRQVLAYGYLTVRVSDGTTPLLDNVQWGDGDKAVSTIQNSMRGAFFARALNEEFQNRHPNTTEYYSISKRNAISLAGHVKKVADYLNPGSEEEEEPGEGSDDGMVVVLAKQQSEKQLLEQATKLLAVLCLDVQAQQQLKSITDTNGIKNSINVVITQQLPLNAENIVQAMGSVGTKKKTKKEWEAAYHGLSKRCREEQDSRYAEQASHKETLARFESLLLKQGDKTYLMQQLDRVQHQQHGEASSENDNAVSGVEEYV